MSDISDALSKAWGEVEDDEEEGAKPKKKRKKKTPKQFMNSAMQGQALVSDNLKRKARRYMESAPARYQESIPSLAERERMIDDQLRRGGR
jgi:hypothetical protein